MAVVMVSPALIVPGPLALFQAFPMFMLAISIVFPEMREPPAAGSGQQDEKGE